ncbi:MAG: hypothetical protein Q8J89_13885 [Caulobacter sp.]|nr:hypothetical protein [Caulobacter sp.]
MDDIARTLLLMIIVSPLFWLASRVHRALSARHGALWATLSRRGDLLAMIRFIWSDAHRALDDPGLSRCIRDFRIGSAVLIAALIAAAALTSRA